MMENYPSADYVADALPTFLRLGRNLAYPNHADEEARRFKTLSAA